MQSSNPRFRQAGDATTIANLFAAVETEFDRFPTLVANKAVFVKDDETGYEYRDAVTSTENTWTVSQIFRKATGTAEYNAGSAASITISLSDRTFQKVTLTQDTTITIDSTGAPVGEYILRIIQDSTGGWNVTFAGLDDDRWSGAHPGVNPDESKETYVKIYFNGTSMRQRMWWVGKEME